MIFKKSIRQFLRTPGKLLLFILLFAVAAFFLCTGVMLWVKNHSIIRAYEDTFMTIGTIQQLPVSTEIELRYDAFTQQYEPRVTGSFSRCVSDAELDFDGADYLLPAVQRPFYGALVPDLELYQNSPHHTIVNISVIEFTPLADSTAEQLTPVEITRVLGGSLDGVKNVNLDKSNYQSEASGQRLLQVGDVILFCDHRNDKPTPLQMGNHYVACVEGSIHDLALLGTSEYRQIIEYRPKEISFCTLCTSKGEPATDASEPVRVQCVTKDFYETGAGRLWLAYAKTLSLPYSTLPVIPTNDTELLLPFYQRSLYIIDGEDIGDAEYAAGNRVCLVSSNFARRNGLQVGDTIRLPLYFANYGSDPASAMQELDLDSGGEWIWGWDLGGTLLDENGARLEVFSDHEYVIRGIYRSALSANAAVSLGANAVVIPAASVQESAEDHIIAHGRMQDSNTSFQIKNGSIENFTALWNLTGLDDIRITFYDRGYSQVQRGLENMKRTCTLFLIIGGAMTMTLLLFFCNLFITKNKPRTAVERMLGYTKKQCAASLLSGFLLAAVLATILGCGIGLTMENRFFDAAMHTAYYDESYSLGKADIPELTDTSIATGPLCVLTAASLMTMTTAVALLFMYGNLREEPLLMLGQKNE